MRGVPGCATDSERADYCSVNEQGAPLAKLAMSECSYMTKIWQGDIDIDIDIEDARKTVLDVHTALADVTLGWYGEIHPEDIQCEDGKVAIGGVVVEPSLAVQDYDAPGHDLAGQTRHDRGTGRTSAMPFLPSVL